MFQDIPRPGLWKRLLLGGFLVVFAAAAATAVAAFHEVDKVVDALGEGTELELGANTLATTDPGQAQTLLILGSDRRPRNNVEGAGGARSDTIMLVRLDPDEEATTIMSLPRDLKVEIPGHGVNKINASYELGGPALTLRTVKRLTGLPINHVVNVTFKGFWRAVNAIGCVYTATTSMTAQSSRSSTSTPATSVCARARRCNTCASATTTPTWCARLASRTSCAR
jgi:polyisoprenyl-teichoic acid--peptidoglycan teichoic acid transferase